ncbi:MAG: glycosyltransferase [Acidobacteriaceae bacterium]|nr:glycosyltransferase [Acidobacteriaceae bacterium]
MSAYWNGAATYYRGIIRGLAKLGHRVTFYEPDAFDRQKNRDMEDPDWARVVVYSADSTENVDRSLSEATECDVLIKASGVGVFDEYLESRVPRIAPGKVTIFWDVDAPATLDRVLNNPHDAFRRLIPEYTAVLTYGGGARVVERYLLLGAKSCLPVYNAADLDSHYLVPPNDVFRADLSLMANRLPDREARIDEFFLGPANVLLDQIFLLGGNGWEDKPKPTSVRYVGHVPTNKHNVVNCSAKAVLNVNRASMAAYGFSPPTRIFEAAAARSCVITDRWEGIESFLKPDHEILVAECGRDVVALLKDLTPETACKIGNAAYRRIADEHTYDHRARQVDAFLRQLAPASLECTAVQA